MSIPNANEIEEMQRVLLADVEGRESIAGIHGIGCPHCGGTMEWDSDWLFEEYTDNGWFIHGEVYTCPACGMFINVSEHFAPHHREVEVRIDDMEYD